MAIAITPDGETAYVASSGEAAIADIDLGDRTAGAVFHTSNTPYGIAITPNQPPSATFSTGAVVAGSPTGFDASASSDPDGAVETYHWDFGDGHELTTTDPTIEHTYAAAGSYDATLTVTDDEGCSTELVFTGQTASCNGSPAAEDTQQLGATAVAVDDSATVYEDSGPTAIDVLANDIGPASVTAVGATSANGDVEITGGGTAVSYEPDPDYCNAPPGTTPDTFTYTITGGSQATVSVTVNCLTNQLELTTAGSGSAFVDSAPAGIGCGRNIAGHADCTQGFDDNATVTLTAHPSANTDFAGFAGAGCAGAGETCDVTMEAAKNVSATFTLMQRTLTVSTTGSGSGTVTGAGIDCGGAGHIDCTETVDDGAAVELTATPASGSQFAGFAGGGCGAASPCMVDVDADKAVTATFSAIPPDPLARRRPTLRSRSPASTATDARAPRPTPSRPTSAALSPSTAPIR